MVRDRNEALESVEKYSRLILQTCGDEKALGGGGKLVERKKRCAVHWCLKLSVSESEQAHGRGTAEDDRGAQTSQGRSRGRSRER